MISTSNLFYRTHIGFAVPNIWHKNMLFNSQDPDIYDHERVTFIHSAINVRWHAKLHTLYSLSFNQKRLDSISF